MCALETTTSSLSDLTHGYLIQPTIILALSEREGYIRFAREWNLTGQATTAAQIPVENAYWGSANDRGASLGPFDAAQATALANTQYTSTHVTITPTEFGVAHSLVDNVMEDSVNGIDLLNLLQGRMLHALALGWDDDLITLFSSLTNNVGTSNQAVTIANMLSAQQGLRTRGVVADAIDYVLDNIASNYLESALSATSTNIATYMQAADRLINYNPTPDNGMNATRHVMNFRGVPVYTSGLTKTANAGVDAVSSCLCASSAVNDTSGATTFGLAWKRLPKFETQRQAKLRATDIVMTSRVGFGIIQNGAGTSITTKNS